MNEEEIREMQEEAEEREKARQERGGATDEQLTQALKELQDPKDPRREEKFLEERAKRKKAEEEGEDPNIGGTVGGVSFEVAAGLATDKATSFLLNPLLGPKGIALYGLANFASGAVANAIAQRMRGDKSFSLGEILASGAAGVIPGSTAKLGKKGSKIFGEANTIKRAAIAGGLTGVGSQQIRVGIDEKRPLTLNEAALAGFVGGTASASMQRIATGASKLANEYYENLQANSLVAYAQTKKRRPKIINRKPTLDRSDVEYVPTKTEIKGVMKALGLPEDDQRAAFVAAVFKKDVADIQATKKFLNDYIYRTTPKNLKGLAEAISAQEGVEYTVADLANIIKNQGAVTTRMVKGMPKSAKRIRNLVDLQAVLKDRLRKLKQQPTFNKGHANSIGQVLKKSNVAGGADRPDNIFIEEARSIFSLDAEGNVKLEKVGNISKKDMGDDPLVVQRMKGFSPTVQESVLKLLRKQDLEVKRVYEGLGIDTSDLDVIENIDLSTAVRPEIRDWTEETVDDLVKAGVDPEKAVDYLLDINEELGDYLTASGLRSNMFLLFKKEPGLAAQFLNELIGKKKRGSGRLKNIPISAFEKQMLATIKDYFKENPVFGFEEVTKIAKKRARKITRAKPGERERLRNIVKKKQDRGNL